MTKRERHRPQSVAAPRGTHITLLTETRLARVTGGVRDYEKEPANLEGPNLVITFPESHT